MKCKNYYFLFFVFILLLWTNGVQATGKITMKTERQPGQKIEMHLKAKGDIGIEGVIEAGQQGYKIYTLTSNEIVINGDITFFACNENDLTEVNVSECASIDTMQVIFNKLKTLDLSANKKLKNVFCYGNKIETLTLGELPELQKLLCHANSLNSIDLSGLRNLRKCWISDNPIQQIDLSANELLEDFSCSNTPISELDLTGAKALKWLNCSASGIKNINVKNCPDLEVLYCSELKIDNIDLSNNKKLKEIALHTNNFTTFDFSAQSDIRNIECYNNNISKAGMDALVASLPIRKKQDRAKLVVVNTQGAVEKNVCSKATVAIAQEKGWKVLDYANGYYTAYEGSEGGGSEENYIRLTTNKPVGSELTFYAVALNPIDIEGAEVLEVDNTTLRLKVLQPDITIKGDVMNFAAQKSGITFAEAKSKLLLSLWLDENELESINLNENSTISVLNVEKNKLKSLDVKSMTGLEELYCGDNMLTELNLTGHSMLTKLACQNNMLESLDFSNTPLIGFIACYGNKINEKSGLFFESLPECQTPINNGKGVILFVDSHNPKEGNVAFKTDVLVGKNKNYDVIDYIGGTAGLQGKPYEGISEQEELKLYVGGVQITPENAGDVLGDGGTVVYDIDSKTLTLNNAQFTSPEGNGGIANSSVDDLTIRLIGNNSVTSQGSYTGLGLSHRTKITGEGSLSINGGSGGIYINKTQLIIENCSVEVVGKAGIVGYDGKSGEELIVDNATIKVTGAQGAAFFLSNIETKQSMFDPQYGAHFDKSARMVVNENGDLFKGTFAIIPETTAIKPTDTDAKAVIMMIYDMQGRRLNELQHGLNIVKMNNGQTRKVIVK